MLAGVLSGINDFALRNVAEPTIREETDVLLKVTATAICTSEVHYAEGYMPISHPFPCGHEFVGTVTAVGSAVRKLKIGDHVDVASFTFDDSCEMCQKGVTGHCLHGALFGSDRSWGDLNGGLAEYVRVPLADTSCIRIPEGVSDEHALLVGDMLGTGYQGVLQADVKPGQTVAVAGLGPVGLSAVTLARRQGAARIIGIGRRMERLHAALECGATDIIDIDSEDVAARVREITGGDPLYPVGSPFTGYVDSCIDCVGDKDATAYEIKILKTGGVISQVGMANPGDFPIEMHDTCMKNVTLRGGVTNQHHMQFLMNCLKTGEINVAPIITHVMALKDFNEALDIFAHKKDRCIKLVKKP
jgi:alcohol dehydrogenase